jgi:hypothetical protein
MLGAKLAAILVREEQSVAYTGCPFLVGALIALHIAGFTLLFSILTF